MVKQGIAIVTWSGGEEAFTTLRNSIPDISYPIIVIVNDGFNAEWTNTWIESGRDYFIKLTGDHYEIGAIGAILDFTNWDEFIFLQDTFEIKNADIFRKLFEDYPNQSVAYNPHFQMYFGKFRRIALNKISFPEVNNKVDAVRQEDIFTKAYRAIEPVAIFNHAFVDQNFYGNYEERWGRKNLVLEDEYIIKRKGTWDAASQL